MTFRPQSPQSQLLVGIALVAGIALMAGCGSGTPSASAGPRFVLDTSGTDTLPSTTFAMDRSGVSRGGHCASLDMAMDSAHMVRDTLRSALLRNGICTWFIPEYDDQQPFRLTSTTYGAVAGVFASPWAGNYTKASDFAKDFVLLGIVDVDTTDGVRLEAPYDNDGLRGGANCVFVHWDEASNVWQAKVTDGGGATCPATAGTARTVPVVALQTPGAPATAYSPGAVFIEGKQLETYIGIRCGDAECVVGAANLSEVPPPLHKGAPGSGSSSRWNMYGWFDEQHVAVHGAAGKLQPGPAASFVPVDNLGDLLPDQFVHDTPQVATVFMPGPPNDKYGQDNGHYKKGYYGLKPGMSKVWMTAEKDPSTGQLVNWTVIIGPNKKTKNPHVTYFTSHVSSGYPVPATARFRWAPNDEQLWMECLVGCCRATQN